MSLRGCCTWTATACMLCVPPMPASFSPSVSEWMLLASTHFVLCDHSSLLAVSCAKWPACFNTAHCAVCSCLHSVAAAVKVPTASGLWLSSPVSGQVGHFNSHNVLKTCTVAGVYGYAGADGRPFAAASGRHGIVVGEVSMLALPATASRHFEDGKHHRAASDSGSKVCCALYACILPHVVIVSLYSQQ